MVADQEVSEEDGGWQSTTDNNENQQRTATHQSTTSQLDLLDQERHDEETHSRHQDDHPELPIIDLLDDITDQMQIVLKSEPTSPRIDCDELESCLQLDHGKGTEDRDGESVQFPDLRYLLQNEARSVTKSRRLSNSDQDASKTDRHAKPSSGTFCSFCQKSFSRAWSLQRHLADTHFYVPQSLACDQCGRSYKSRNSLVSHKSQYHARKERKDHETQQLEITY